MIDHAEIITWLHRLDSDRGWEVAACQDALAALDALEAENQRLRDALEPFLKAATDYEPHHAARPDDSWVLLVESQDVLAARATLDETPTEVTT